jgi:hypothetical protein
MVPPKLWAKKVLEKGFTVVDYYYLTPPVIRKNSSSDICTG